MFARFREALNRLMDQQVIPLVLQPPVLYLITNGETTSATTPASKEFSQIIKLVEAAVTAEFNLIQLREKQLSARVLYELTVQASSLVRNTKTRLLVNDRSDIAIAGGADGVHLAQTSVNAKTVRQMFGADFLIGVSTHSEAEALQARDDGANLAVYGPVFPTSSKERYGPPVGPASLRQSALSVRPLSLLALGGISLENVKDCFQAGAAGIAGISLFQERAKLADVAKRIRESFSELDTNERS